MEFLEASIFQKGYIDGITILNLDGEILFSAKFNKKLSNWMKRAADRTEVPGCIPKSDATEQYAVPRDAVWKAGL